MTNEEKAQYIEDHLTRKDVREWHKGQRTRHVEKLMVEVDTDEIQVWGSHDGTEPLSVTVH